MKSDDDVNDDESQPSSSVNLGSAKAALKAVKKKITKYEKWEILKDKEVKILEAAPGYVTLKQQYDDELDQALERDVFAVR